MLGLRRSASKCRAPCFYGEILTMIKEPNIIFLDVDGVLNSAHTNDYGPSGCIGVEDEKVKLLRQIQEKHDASLVLTSTWKLEYPDGKDYLYLCEKLAKENMYITDITRDDLNLARRGRGILAWLNSHPHDKWIVLDDEMFCDYKELKITSHLVRTSFADGLLPKHLRYAEKIFAQQERKTS